MIHIRDYRGGRLAEFSICWMTSWGLLGSFLSMVEQARQSSVVQANAQMCGLPLAKRKDSQDEELGAYGRAGLAVTGRVRHDCHFCDRGPAAWSIAKP